MAQTRLALYTTVYPGVEPYLPAWLRSVYAQTDQGFDIWIGLDVLSPEDVINAMGNDPKPTWVQSNPGATPTQIRQQAIEQMVCRYPGIVFVDSDDLLEPERIAYARHSLAVWDVCGCAMRLVDKTERDMGVIFQWPEHLNQKWDLLVRANAFGLGNTAYRSSLLKKCLPIPPECVMEDWFLITRAWTQGARINFERECRMAYRQHGANMTAVLPPFTEQQVLRTAGEVLQHHTFVLTCIPELQAAHRLAIQQARHDVEKFQATMIKKPQLRSRYMEALNQLPPTHIWFDCVAHPELDMLWRN